MDLRVAATILMCISGVALIATIVMAIRAEILMARAERLRRKIDPLAALSDEELWRRYMQAVAEEHPPATEPEELVN